jgi:hypothetical protein
MKVFGKVLCLITVATLWAVVVPSLVVAGTVDKGYVISLEGGKQIHVRKVGDSSWQAELDGKTYLLRTEAGNRYLFSPPGERPVDGMLKDGKMKMMRGGAIFMEVKLGPEKIKVNPTGREADTWSFKLKGEKIKVSRLDIEMGKVKYYPESGKLKAKDSNGLEAAASKDIGRLSASLAPFLMGEPVTREQRIFLVLLCFAIGR